MTPVNFTTGTCCVVGHKIIIFLNSIDLVDKHLPVPVVKVGNSHRQTGTVMRMTRGEKCINLIDSRLLLLQII